jgi:hypothetical protein
MGYEFQTAVQGDNTLLTVTWTDEDGNVIISGNKLIKGHDCPCEAEAAFFAEDLKKNFAELFPPESMPDVDMFGMGGIE